MLGGGDYSAWPRFSSSGLLTSEVKSSGYPASPVWRPGLRDPFGDGLRARVSGRGFPNIMGTFWGSP